MYSKVVTAACTAEPTILKNKFSALELENPNMSKIPIPTPRKRTSLGKKVTFVQTNQETSPSTKDRFTLRNSEHRLPPSYPSHDEATQINAARVQLTATTETSDNAIECTAAKYCGTPEKTQAETTKQTTGPSGGEQIDMASKKHSWKDQNSTGPSGGEQLSTLGMKSMKNELEITGPSGGEQTETSEYTRSNANQEQHRSEPSWIAISSTWSYWFRPKPMLRSAVPPTRVPAVLVQ